MIKLVAIDLDGTLLNKNLEIPQDNINAINTLKEKGIKVVIATGRPEQLVKPYVDLLEMENDLIMYNGSVIGHPFKDERFYKKSLSKESVNKIVTFCEKNDYLYMIYTKDAIISKPNYRVSFFEKRNENLIDKHKCVFKDVREMDKILDLDIQKILIIDKDELRYTFAHEYMSKLKDCSVVKSQNGFIDVNPKGTSKGEALRVYSENIGIKKEEIAAIGDQDNDVSMLEYATLSIAMENATDNAKEVCDFFTLSNNNAGVAYAINNFILK